MVESPFALAIQKLQALGAFEFVFPFLLTSAIFYGLLRRSKIFGEPEHNIAINGVVALIAGFMVWAYPILTGVDPSRLLSEFLFQSMVALLIIIVGLLMAGMFLPEDLSKQIGEKIGGRGRAIILIAGLMIGLGVFLASGLSQVFFPQGLGGGGSISFGTIDDTTLLTIVVLIVMAIGMLAITGVGQGGKKS